MPAARRAALAATFIQFVTAMPLPAQAQTAGLAPGQWSVGFTHLVVADSTRRLPSGRARPIDIGVWYPTRISGSARLTYRDYVRMTPPPSDSSPSADARPELDGFVAFLESHGAAPDAVEQWLAAPMLATADAPPSGSRFPLVLVAQGNAQTFQDQAPLAEYLASHGYVVATSPSPMRITGPLTDEKEVGARAEEQAVDLAFVASGIAGRPDVSEARIGIVAHSFGARAALLLSMREPRVAAIVSLDGGIGTATGRTSFEALPSYHAGAVRAPILHFCERLDSVHGTGFRPAPYAHVGRPLDRHRFGDAPPPLHEPRRREPLVSRAPAGPRCDGRHAGIVLGGSRGHPGVPRRLPRSRLGLAVPPPPRGVAAARPGGAAGPRTEVIQRRPRFAG